MPDIRRFARSPTDSCSSANACLLAICNHVCRKTGRASPHVLLNVNWFAAVLQCPCLFCQLLKALNNMTKLGFNSAAPGQASVLPYTRLATIYLPQQSNRLNFLRGCKQWCAACVFSRSICLLHLRYRHRQDSFWHTKAFQKPSAVIYAVASHHLIACW